MDYRIGLVGTGRLGTALAGELFRRGLSLVAVTGREPLRTAQWAKRFSTTPVDGGEMAARADVVILATPDGAIASVSDDLSQQGDWRGKIVLHTSGSLDASVLSPLEQAGAYTGSFHPLCSFAGEPCIPKGIFYGIEGSASALAVAEALAYFFEGRPFRLRPGLKPLYHAAACMAANYMVTLTDAACSLMISAGLAPKEASQALAPLVEGVIANIHLKGVEGALTGPICRGDHKTVKSHIQALREKNPEFLPLYMEMARQTLPLAVRAGLSENKCNALKAELEEGES